MAQKRIVIIGGVAAGATAAARARRLDETAEITLLEKGPYVSFANCGLPYFLSGDIKRRSSLLLQTPEGFFSRYRVNVKTKTEAVEILRNEHVVVARTLDGEVRWPYDKLILAQGGSPVVPPLQGVDLPHVFKLWTIPDMDRIQKYLEERKPAKAVIAGGGFIGLEMAEALKVRGLEVTVVELAPRVMITMDPEFGLMVEAGLKKEGVDVRTGVALTGITEEAVRLSDGSSLSAGIVLLSVGVRPELTLAAKAGIEIGPSGGVVVNERLETNDPDIYAAGDMVEIVQKVSGRRARIPLAGPANRQGRIAATNALGGHMTYRGALGTSVVKIFGHTAASTGLSEKGAREAGIDAGAAYVFKDQHVAYYPGASVLSFKLVYDRTDGRVLGAQAYGESGVEKRIDVIAVALQGRMSVHDLSELDLAYAPPFNSANDPVNMASFIAQNALSGYSPSVAPAEALEAIRKAGAMILDVRTVGEQGKAPLAGAVHIPADELRDRLEEVPKGKPLFILSKDGFLGHTTLQVLKANGWKDVMNIAGGYAAARWVEGWVFNV
jgi:NADPH-dependent 2,4-dienoyl-CoA reductase/sulfur reductase-like enzyme/rhodanese-related sulfurtransferase